MRNTQSQSKLLSSSSVGKNSRVKNQKELRQAQRQQTYYTSQQDPDLQYTPNMSRTVKHSERASIVSMDSSSGQLAGNLSQTPGGLVQKNIGHVSRSKLMNSSGSQQQNLFGGLSRHIINANSTATQQSAKCLSVSAVGSYGATDPSGQILLSQQSHYPSTPGAKLITKHTSQHNAAYQTVLTSPQINNAQPCGRTLAALESMNQSQQKMRKSESQNLQFKQASTAPTSFHGAQSYAVMQTQNFPSNSQKLQRILNPDKPNNVYRQKGGKNMGSEKQSFLQTQGHAMYQYEQREEPDDFQTRSLTAVQQMQPQPMPHKQFLSPRTKDEAMYQTQAFTQRNSIHQSSDFKEGPKASKLYASNQISKKAASKINSFAASELLLHQQQKSSNDVQVESQPTSKDESLSQSAHIEQNTTPELTTPAFKNEQLRASGQLLNSLAFSQRPAMSDKTTSIHVCCHEQTKQIALAEQKIQFMSEQLSEQESQAKMKEQQFNKIIATLKKTAEENNNTRKPNHSEQQQDNSKSQNLNPNEKEIQETYAELNTKKEEVNELQEQVLKLELQAEKAALDLKIRLQQKDDEIGEERLKCKHKESDLRNAISQIERLNEDQQNKIQEALDRQSERLGNEKQADIDAMNRRNEQLIKQLVENHSIETRQLRNLLLEQERKCRDTEHMVGNLEIELRTVKLENDGRMDASELEEIAAVNQHVNEIRLQTMQNQFSEENQQLRDVIDSLEQQIGQIKESKSEADRKLIITEDKINEVKKEIVRNKAVVASQKEKEEKMQTTFKAQIAKERKTADMAVNKIKGVQKLEKELNKKQIVINALRAKILEMEREETHKSKILLMKRRQIEDEKVVLIKKQALRQRSQTRSNLSATRLQQKLETQQAVIQTERDSKKALIQEKSKLEKQIVTIKRDKGPINNNGDSSRHNESMSMYFARSQGMFSPRTKADPQSKSFIAKGSNTARHQVFASMQGMDRNQLYLSKQFSHGQRTSSAGENSLQGGDSIVNIVEFEEQISPQSQRRLLQSHSMISTPFKNDEPNESKISKLNFKTKAQHSQSVLEQHKSNQTPQHANEHHEVPPSDKTLPASGPEINQFSIQEQQQPTMTRDNIGKHFKQFDNKQQQQHQIEKIQDQEEEFIQVLSGCDTSNDSVDNIKNKQMLRSLEKNPGMQMARKNNYICQNNQGVVNNMQQNTIQNTINASQSASKAAKSERKEVQEIKLIQGQQQTQGKTTARTKNQTNASASKNTAGQRTSPSKLHANMSSILSEQRLIDSKESFVRTVLTARQECEQFNETIRQKDEHALTTRNHLTMNQQNVKALDQTEIIASNQNGVQLRQSSSFDAKQAQNNTLIIPQSSTRIVPQNHANIRQMHRTKTQQQFNTQIATAQTQKRSPISRTPLNYSNDAKEMVDPEEQVQEERKTEMDQMSMYPAGKETKSKMVKNRSNATTAKMGDGSSFDGMILQQLENMTGSIDNGSHREGISRSSNTLAEENNVLKEQLDLVKRSLALHQEKAATTEMTMMDAILQMKEQINTVMITKMSPQPVEDESFVRSQDRMRQSMRSSNQPHEDYHAMTNITHHQIDEEPQTVPRNKKVRAKVMNDFNSTEQQPIRKTNSMHQRQRSDPSDLAQVQAESVYKKIKIKSPSKRSIQNGVGMQPSASANFFKQTSSSTAKRNSQQQHHYQQVKSPNNISNFNQPQNYQLVQRDMPTNSNNQSFLANSTVALSQRLSVGVLKQSAQQSVRKISSINKASAQKQNSSFYQ